MRSILTVLIAVLTVTCSAEFARADYYVWRDEATGVSISFPDTWRMVSNADPDDVITIMAPAGRGNAQCRVRTHEDGRYKIYPPRYDWAIQKIDFSFDFWTRYLGEYNDAQIFNVQNGAGLGRGYAGYAVAAYKSPVPGPYMNRQGLMFATLYHDDVYVLECSSHEDAFADWKGAFLSIAKSIDFRKTHHQLLTGHYRDFMKDPRITFPAAKGEGVEYY